MSNTTTHVKNIMSHTNFKKELAIQYLISKRQQISSSSRNQFPILVCLKTATHNNQRTSKVKREEPQYLRQRENGDYRRRGLKRDRRAGECEIVLTKKRDETQRNKDGREKQSQEEEGSKSIGEAPTGKGFSLPPFVSQNYRRNLFTCSPKIILALVGSNARHTKTVYLDRFGLSPGESEMLDLSRKSP